MGQLGGFTRRGAKFLLAGQSISFHGESRASAGWTQHQAPASRALGLDWDGLWSCVTLSHLCFRCLRGPLLFRCFCSRERRILEPPPRRVWEKGRCSEKRTSPSLQSRLNDLHQAEGPWQESEVTSALNHSPED